MRLAEAEPIWSGERNVPTPGVETRCVSNERSSNDPRAPFGLSTTDTGLVEVRSQLASEGAWLGFFGWNTRLDALFWENDGARRLLGRPSEEESVGLHQLEAEVIHEGDAGHSGKVSPWDCRRVDSRSSVGFAIGTEVSGGWNGRGGPSSMGMARRVGS